MSRLVREIMGQLPEDFIRRMRNWAAAKAGSSMPYAQVNWSSEVAATGRNSATPILGGEADDTDHALQTLDVRYRRAVELYWSWEQQELAVLARRCGGIDYTTYAKRVMEGHSMLRAEIARQSDAWRRRREHNKRSAGAACANSA